MFFWEKKLFRNENLQKMTVLLIRMANGINAVRASKTTDTTFGETSHINQTGQNFDWVGKLDAIKAT